MEALHPYLAKKDHIIWDWNGTLLGDLDLAVATINRLLREENLPAMSAEKYKAIFRFPVIDFYGELGFDTTPEKFLLLCQRFNDQFYAGLKECSLWPGVKSTLMHVKSLGKTQSILSASEQNLLNASVRLFAIEAHLDHVMGIPDLAAASKVERGRLLMKNVGIAAAKTVLIGDTDHDLEVAKALGIEAVLVDHGHQHGDRLRAIHHTVLKLF